MTDRRHAERRHFQRVLFDTLAILVHANQRFATQLIDISLKGALVKLPEAWQATGDEPVELVIPIDEVGDHIGMTALPAHTHDGQLGLRCTEIDLESITHLRRLVELNTGDETLLERELEALL